MIFIYKQIKFEHGDKCLKKTYNAVNFVQKVSEQKIKSLVINICV